MIWPCSLRTGSAIALVSAILAGCASPDVLAGQDGPDSGDGSDSGSAPTSDGGGTHSDSGGSSPDSGGSHPEGGAVTPDGGASNPDSSTPTPDGGAGGDAGCPTGAAAQVEPPGFWDDSNVPASQNLVMLKFLNRTNGKFKDSELYWADASNIGDGKGHSFASGVTYDAAALSGRMYFYICSPEDASNYQACANAPTSSKYFDWVEHNVFLQGSDRIWAGNTTRVNEFGLKLSYRVEYASGSPDTRGEDYGTFCEDRAATFQRFIDEVPMEFKLLAQAPFAPYQIPEPGTGGVFNQYPDYYTAWEQQLWSANGITLPLPGKDLTAAPLSQLADLTAAIHRHTGGAAGSFNSDGTTASGSTVCANDKTFYQTAPYDGYAKFWHDHALGGKTYGFNYDDSCGTESSYVWATNPKVVLVAVGW